MRPDDRTRIVHMIEVADAVADFVSGRDRHDLKPDASRRIRRPVSRLLANEGEPFVLAEHRYPQFFCLAELRAGAGAGHHVIGVA